jgi:hypothetical protein
MWREGPDSPEVQGAQPATAQRDGEAVGGDEVAIDRPQKAMAYRTRRRQKSAKTDPTSLVFNSCSFVSIRGYILTETSASTSARKLR